MRARVKDELKAELVHIEVEAAIQIAHINGDGLKPQVRVLPIEANRGTINPVARRISHGPALYSGRKARAANRFYR